MDTHAHIYNSDKHTLRCKQNSQALSQLHTYLKEKSRERTMGSVNTDTHEKGRPNNAKSRRTR